MVEKKKELLISELNINIVDAMKKIDKNATGVLLIVDDCKRLIGALSDGDIRRWLIRTGNLDTPIKSIMNNSPKYLHAFEADRANEFMKRLKIHVIPIVDEYMHILDIIIDDDNSLNIKSIEGGLANVPVVIMAGGKGTRLHPYTKILPKPLIPIGDLPIIEHIINRFNNYNVSDYYITINYKAGMIKSYFSELSPNYNIHYVHEDIPLGTAGSLKLIENKFEKPFVVSNCDILIDTNYQKMYEYHLNSGNILTAVSATKNIYIPYGVFQTGEQGSIKKIEEKPRLSYLVNTGMYIVDPKVVECIPDGKMFHMTELIELLIENGYKVGIYPVSEDSFLDMGEFEEMQRMEKLLGNIQE